jgi:hypothetical protein
LIGNILSAAVRASALSSGTMSFVGSILQAEELSIGNTCCGKFWRPFQRSAAAGREIAIAGLALIASAAHDGPFFFQNKVFTDFSEATGISSVTGKFLSLHFEHFGTYQSGRTHTAIFIFYSFESLKIKKPSLLGEGFIILDIQNNQTPSLVQGFLVLFFVYVEITFIEA